MMIQMMRIRSWTDRNPYLAALILNLVLLLIPIFCGTLKYEVSDDFLMELIVSGKYSGTPSPWIMFMNPLLGQMFCLLYSIIPSFNWYTWFQLVLIFASLSMISGEIIKRVPRFRFCILFLFLLTSLDFYNLMQFTKTAALCSCVCMTAVFLFAVLKKKRYLFCSLLFGSMGILIRSRAFLLMGPTLAVLCMLALFFSQNKKEVFQRIALEAVCLGLTFGAGTFYSNFFVRSDPEYAVWSEVSKARSTILDYEIPPFEEVETRLTESGVSQTEYNLAVSWKFADPQTFDSKKLGLIADVLNEYRQEHSRSWKDNLKSLINRRYWFYVCFWISLILSLLLLFGWKNSLIPLVLLASAAFSTLYLNQHLGRVVYRVEFSIYLIYICSILLLPMTGWIKPDSAGTQSKRKIGQIVRLILCSGSIGVYTLLSIPAARSDKYEIMNYSWANDLKKYGLVFSSADYRAFNDYIKSHPEQIFFLDFNTGIQNYYLSFSPLQSIPDGIFDHLFFLAGVDTRNPEKIEGLKKQNISSELRSLAKDNVRIIINDDQHDLISYLNSATSKTCELVLEKEADGFRIYQIRQKEN